MHIDRRIILNDMKLKLGREFWILIAIALLQAVATPGAVASDSCSVLTSQVLFPYSQSGLAARNKFLGTICGGANGDIFMLQDARFKDRVAGASKGHASHDRLYPDKARRRHLEGRVVIAVVVERDGSIQHTAVIETSGHGILDDAAMDWLKKGYYESPAKLDGQPVRVLSYFPIRFRLPSGTI